MITNIEQIAEDIVERRVELPLPNLHRDFTMAADALAAEIIARRDNTQMRWNEYLQNHLAGKHPQKTHGKWSPGNKFNPTESGKRGDKAKELRKLRKTRPQKGLLVDSDLEKSDRDRVSQNGRLVTGRGKLSKEEGEAVEAYTDSHDFNRINGDLRGGVAINQIPPPGVVALNRLAGQPLAEPVVTYRGISNERADAILDHGGFESSGFMSTSQDPIISLGFGGIRARTVLAIQTKKGLPVSDKSQYEDEYEVVHQHGAKYKVLEVRNIEYTSPGRDPEINRTIIMEQL